MGINGIKIGGLAAMIAVFGIVGFVIFAPPVFARNCDYYDEVCHACDNNCSDIWEGALRVCNDTYDACPDNRGRACSQESTACQTRIGNEFTACLNACESQQPSPPPPSSEPPPAQVEPSCDVGEYYSNGQCYCNSGARLNGACVTLDQWCRATYGENIHAENGNCSCNEGYGLAKENGSCITYDQICQSQYGVNSYGDKNNCHCRSGYVFDANKQCVPESKSTITPPTIEKPQDTSQKQETGLSNEDAGVVALRWFLAMGYDASQIPGMLRGVAAVAVGPQKLSAQAHKDLAKIAFDKAEAARSQAFKDGTLNNPERIEGIRKMYLDSLLDNPNDKKTLGMMSMIEGKKGNESLADFYEKLSLANLTPPERAALLSGKENARTKIREDMFHDQEMTKAQQEQALKDSSFMNQAKGEINDFVAGAQESAKNLCYKVSACDWAYAKKVEIMTIGEKLSRKVETFMDDTFNAVLGFDRKKAKNEWGIK